MTFLVYLASPPSDPENKSKSKMLEISDFATPNIMSVVSGVAKRIMPLFDRVLIQVRILIHDMSKAHIFMLESCR